MLKLWLGNVIYISGGGFASEPIGDFETSVNGSNSSTTNGIEKKLDYGYGGGIGLNIPIGGIGLFFDGLYLKGINNLNDSPGATLKVATLIARAGLRF
jgi:hypothetical protein